MVMVAIKILVMIDIIIRMKMAIVKRLSGLWVSRGYVLFISRWGI